MTQFTVSLCTCMEYLQRDSLFGPESALTSLCSPTRVERLMTLVVDDGTVICASSVQKDLCFFSLLSSLQFHFPSRRNASCSSPVHLTHDQIPPLFGLVVQLVRCCSEIGCFPVSSDSRIDPRHSFRMFWIRDTCIRISCEYDRLCTDRSEKGNQIMKFVKIKLYDA